MHVCWRCPWRALWQETFSRLWHSSHSWPPHPPAQNKSRSRERQTLYAINLANPNSFVFIGSLVEPSDTVAHALEDSLALTLLDSNGRQPPAPIRQNAYLTYLLSLWNNYRSFS